VATPCKCIKLKSEDGSVLIVKDGCACDLSVNTGAILGWGAYIPEEQ
jgi:hypothetical protein